MVTDRPFVFSMELDGSLMFPDLIAHSFWLSLFFLWFRSKIDIVFPSVRVLLEGAACSHTAAMSPAASKRLQKEAHTDVQAVMFVGVSKFTL